MSDSIHDAPRRGRRAAPALLVLVPILATACSSGPSAPSAPGRTPATQLTLRAGQAVAVPGRDATLRLVAVREDSRCPVDVNCVWEGNARVTLALEERGARREVDLNTALEPRSAVVDGLSIRLLGVEPVKREGVPIPPGDYIARVEVESSGP